MKKKSLIRILILVLIFVISGCGNSNKEGADSNSHKKESDYAKFEKELDTLGMNFENVILSMMDNDLDKVSNESKDLIKNVSSTQEKLDDSKVSTDFKNDLSNLFSTYDQFAKEIVNGNYDISDLSHSVGAENRALADKYNDGVLPSSLENLSEKIDEKQAEIEEKEKELTNKVYKKDEIWEVPGQWKLKVNSVKSTDDRNQFSDKKPGQVVIVDYTYENLGYTSDIQDLFIYPSGIIDSSGQMGDSYPAVTEHGPKTTPVGATTSNAQKAFGLITPGGNIRIIFNLYDSNHEKQTANFELSVE